MQSSITKNNLEELILQTIKTGSLKEEDLPKECYSDLTSKALAIHKKSLELWNILFEKSIPLDKETLHITRTFYEFISNIPNYNVSLYLNCTSLLNSYLEICLDNSPSYLSIVR